MQPSAEQRLWQAVAIRMMADLADPTIAEHYRHEEQVDNQRRAMSWFGSRACEEVCAMAGVDHSLVMRLFRSGELKKMADERTLERFGQGYHS